MKKCLCFVTFFQMYNSIKHQFVNLSSKCLGRDSVEILLKKKKLYRTAIVQSSKQIYYVHDIIGYLHKVTPIHLFLDVFFYFYIFKSFVFPNIPSAVKKKVKRKMIDFAHFIIWPTSGYRLCAFTANWYSNAKIAQAFFSSRDSCICTAMSLAVFAVQFYRCSDLHSFSGCTVLKYKSNVCILRRLW